MSGPRVAIVHERFTETGGSERVVEQLYALWPNATVHAALVDPAALPQGLRGADVRSSAIQPLYRGGRRYAYLLPLLPAAIAGLDVSHADMVITSHHAFANRVRPRPDALLVSYTHTPARWMWQPRFLSDEAGGLAGRLLLRGFAWSQRQADVAAARRANLILTNSRHVADRVKRWWGRDSTVVAPPVEIARFTPDPRIDREDFFLYAGRLVPYKRPHIAAAAARRSGRKLLVVGDGRMRAAVEAAGGSSVQILGHVDDDTLLDLYRRCQAVLLPGEEDFGIIPVEAQACGTPVLARGVGGVRDSVLPGVTGHLYPAIDGAGEVDALADAMRRFDATSFDPEVLRAHAEGFSADAFRARFGEAVRRLIEQRDMQAPMVHSAASPSGGR
ncbi:MAG: glycosyltransferase [Actinomycetota bacterium]|nr:glycosyltransferase [Actinomycetota bacterium]